MTVALVTLRAGDARPGLCPADPGTSYERLMWTVKAACHQELEEKGPFGLVSRGVAGFLPTMHDDPA
jgi:hypothetical protein